MEKALTITDDGNNLHISIVVPRTQEGTDTYGDGTWVAPAVCVHIDEKREEYALYHTQFLDYKDSLQATAPIAYFGSKEEALEAAQEFDLGIEYASN